MNNDSDEHYEFPVAVQWLGEHKGELRLEGKPNLPLSSPTVFGGLSNYYTPQELFVSSIATCYLTTFMTIYKRMKEDIQDYKIKGVGIIERVPEGGWRFSKIVITLFITIPKSGSKMKIKKAVDLSHKYCMVSRSVNCQIHLESIIQFA